MLHSHSVLGLSPIASVVDVAAPHEPPKTFIGVIMEAIRNPLHAALAVMIYFVWWTTHNVDASQKSMHEQLIKQNQSVEALVKSDQDKTSVLRMICIGVNKPSDKWKCGQ
jgi:hypothetical protein